MLTQFVTPSSDQSEIGAPWYMQAICIKVKLTQMVLKCNFIALNKLPSLTYIILNPEAQPIKQCIQ
jgi:hypothetical protein